MPSVPKAFFSLRNPISSSMIRGIFSSSEFNMFALILDFCDFSVVFVCGLLCFSFFAAFLLCFFLLGAGELPCDPALAARGAMLGVFGGDIVAGGGCSNVELNPKPDSSPELGLIYLGGGPPPNLASSPNPPANLATFDPLFAF